MSKLHIVSVLDRSGSMMGTEQEVIGAFNAFVEEQARITAENNIKATMTLILFDNMYEEVYVKTPIDEVPKLTSEVYFTRGMTALYDAVGKAITSLEGKKKVIFFIETDGMENASVEHTSASLKALVSKKKEDGWDFNFVGADLDKFTTENLGASLGIIASKTMVFSKSDLGYKSRNASFADATTMYIGTKEDISN